MPSSSSFSSLSESSGSESSASSLSESSRSDSSLTSESQSSISSLSDNLSSSSSGSSDSSSSRSDSSSSSSTESSLSDTSSSWSSESSEWDDVWYSLFNRPAPRLVGYQFMAEVSIDLRHSDAVVVERLGPLTANFGGRFGDDLFVPEICNIVDGYRNCKAFSSLDSALTWQTTVLHRVRTAIKELRRAFLTQYPGEFDDRHRRV